MNIIHKFVWTNWELNVFTHKQTITQIYKDIWLLVSEQKFSLSVLKWRFGNLVEYFHNLGGLKGKVSAGGDDLGMMILLFLK